MRVLRVGLIGLAVILWAVAASVEAATYYVDQGAPDASDENPGTEGQPWRTLGKAADSAVAGDTVWIKAGVYRETLHVTKSGEPGKSIVFQAFGDHPVMITSPKYAVTGWKKVKGTKNIYEAPAPDVHNRTRAFPPFLLAVDGKAVSGPAPGPGSPYQFPIQNRYGDPGLPHAALAKFSPCASEQGRNRHEPDPSRLPHAARAASPQSDPRPRRLPPRRRRTTQPMGIPIVFCSA